MKTLLGTLRIIIILGALYVGFIGYTALFPELSVVERVVTIYGTAFGLWGVVAVVFFRGSKRTELLDQLAIALILQAVMVSFLFWPVITGGLVAAFLVVVGLGYLPEIIQGNGPSRKHLRGDKLISFKEAQAQVKGSLGKEDRGISWGGVLLPSKAGTNHFAITGTTGSGKTTIMQDLMAHVLPVIGSGQDRRALIYDAKSDILGFLQGLKLDVPIHIFNPFDQRCVSWDMAADITSRASAMQMAGILCPKEKASANKFFDNTTQICLSAVMAYLNDHCAGNWTFRDLILATRSLEHLRQMMKGTPDYSHNVAFFANEETGANVLATLHADLKYYGVIASAWHKAKKRISLKEWLKTEAIIVLGNDPEIQSALDAINQVIFRRLVELVIKQEETKTRQTWFFLDEVRLAGRLGELSKLLLLGRSKGACVVLGFQDIEGLREVYGQKVADEILGQCGQKAVLRLENAETAKWASGLFGKSEVIQTSTSENFSVARSGAVGVSPTTGEGESATIAIKDNVMPSQFMSLPSPLQGAGLTGYFRSPFSGGYKHTFDNAWYQRIPKPALEVQNYIPRAETDQILEPWTEEDLIRLKLSSESEEEKPPHGVKQTQNVLSLVQGAKLNK